MGVSVLATLKVPVVPALTCRLYTYILRVGIRVAQAKLSVHIPNLANEGVRLQAIAKSDQASPHTSCTTSPCSHAAAAAAKKQTTGKRRNKESCQLHRR